MLSRLMHQPSWSKQGPLQSKGLTVMVPAVVMSSPESCEEGCPLRAWGLWAPLLGPFLKVQAVIGGPSGLSALLFHQALESSAGGSVDGASPPHRLKSLLCLNLCCLRFARASCWGG
jgi:hypothetical protein